MNERIKQLAEQSGISRQYQEEYFGPKLLEQFTELIVKECADFVDGAISDGGVDGRSLKEHFGVD